MDARATMIGELSGGSLIGGRIDVFGAPWMARLFADLGATQWAAYARGREPGDPALELFEVAHFVADLAQVDGAVVLTDHLDVIGFGGEIAAGGPELTRVSRALDLEGTRREWVRTDRVGTRHRSAYRLCQEAHDVVAIVVSQDGGLRFVRWHDNAVTYWDQVATGPWEA